MEELLVEDYVIEVNRIITRYNSGKLTADEATAEMLCAEDYYKDVLYKEVNDGTL